MKIHAAPSGNQKMVKGNVVNVLADISSTVKHLPLVPNESYTIQVELKCQLKYKHPVLFQRAAKYLTQNSKLFNENGISYDETWQYGKPRITDSVPSQHCLKDKNKISEESNFQKSKFELKKDDIHRGSSHNADLLILKSKVGLVIKVKLNVFYLMGKKTLKMIIQRLRF